MRSSVRRDTLDAPCATHSSLLAVLSSRERWIQSGTNEPPTHQPTNQTTNQQTNKQQLKEPEPVSLHFRSSALHVGSGMSGRWSGTFPEEEEEEEEEITPSCSLRDNVGLGTHL